MSSLHSQFGDQHWRDLYLQALFETDKRMLPFRIREAQGALLKREQELFAKNGSSEREAINSALHSLRVLKQCFHIAPSAAA